MEDIELRFSPHGDEEANDESGTEDRPTRSAEGAGGKDDAVGSPEGSIEDQAATDSEAPPKAVPTKAKRRGGKHAG